MIAQRNRSVFSRRHSVNPRIPVPSHPPRSPPPAPPRPVRLRSAPPGSQTRQFGQRPRRSRLLWTATRGKRHCRTFRDSNGASGLPGHGKPDTGGAFSMIAWLCTPQRGSAVTQSWRDAISRPRPARDQAPRSRYLRQSLENGAGVHNDGGTWRGLALRHVRDWRDMRGCRAAARRGNRSSGAKPASTQSCRTRAWVWCGRCRSHWRASGVKCTGKYN